MTFSAVDLPKAAARLYRVVRWSFREDSSFKAVTPQSARHKPRLIAKANTAKCRFVFIPNNQCASPPNRPIKEARQSN